jgi:hypothetical protein
VSSDLIADMKIRQKAASDCPHYQEKLVKFSRTFDLSCKKTQTGKIYDYSRLLTLVNSKAINLLSVSDN